MLQMAGLVMVGGFKEEEKSPGVDAAREYVTNYCSSDQS